MSYKEAGLMFCFLSKLLLYRTTVGTILLLTLQPLHCDYNIYIHCYVDAQMIFCLCENAKTHTWAGCPCNSDLNRDKKQNNLWNRKKLQT